MFFFYICFEDHFTLVSNLVVTATVETFISAARTIECRIFISRAYLTTRICSRFVHFQIFWIMMMITTCRPILLPSECWLESPNIQTKCARIEGMAESHDGTGLHSLRGSLDQDKKIGFKKGERLGVWCYCLYEKDARSVTATAEKTCFATADMNSERPEIQVDLKRVRQIWIRLRTTIPNPAGSTALFVCDCWISDIK